jgi:hypothetical protein
MISATSPVPLATPALTSREFDQIRRLAYDQFGLELRPGKEQLVSARLSKIIRAMNLKSFQQYCDFLLADTIRRGVDGHDRCPCDESHELL